MWNPLAPQVPRLVGLPSLACPLPLALPVSLVSCRVPPYHLAVPIIPDFSHRPEQPAESNPTPPASSRHAPRLHTTTALLRRGAGCAMSATRLYLQEERQIATDPCDNRIIRLNNCLMILSCICNILAIFCQELEQIAQLIECIQYIVFYIPAGCMIGQTALEMQRHPTAADY